VEKRSRVENPFKASANLQGKVNLPRDKRARIAELRSNATPVRPTCATSGRHWHRLAQTRTVLKRRKEDANNMADSRS